MIVKAKGDFFSIKAKLVFLTLGAFLVFAAIFWLQKNVSYSKLAYSF
jgi:hypothetical protein